MPKNFCHNIIVQWGILLMELLSLFGPADRYSCWQGIFSLGF